MLGDTRRHTKAFADGLHDKAGWNGSNDELDRDTLLKNQQRWDGPNFEACGQLRIGRGVDLHNP
jgi:hypothetical protein